MRASAIVLILYKMSLQTLIKRGLDTPVDFSFIKRVVGRSPTIRMVDHETGLGPRPSLRDVFRGREAVAILLHIVQGKTKIGHWVCLLKAHPQRNRICFFDSLGLGLYKLYNITHEEPKLLHALKGHKWENSSVQLQRFGSHFRECGAFVSIRCKFWKLTNSAFVRLIKSYNKTKPDETAVMLVLLHYLEDEEVDITSKKFKRIK